MTALPGYIARLRTESAALLHIGAPLMATQLIQMAAGFFDTVMMGRVGPLELAMSRCWYGAMAYLVSVCAGYLNGA